MKKNALPKGTLKQVLRYLRPYRALIVLSVFFALISASIALYIPILIGEAIDLLERGAGTVDFGALAARLLTVGGLVLLAALSQWLMNTINNRVTYHVIRDMRCEAFEKIERLPLSYIDTHSTGDTVSRIISDADTFADGLLLGFTQLFTGVITIVGTLVFMVVIRAQVALIVVLLTPLSLLIARFIATRTHKMFLMQSQTRGEETGYIDEMIGNQKTVQAFSMEKATAQSFDEIDRRLESCSLRAIFFSSLVNPTTRFINSTVYAAVALVGALTCIFAGAGDPFSIGELTCLLAYVNQYTKPFNEISGVATEFQNALACAGRIFALLHEPEQTPDAADARVLTDVRGDVSLSDVSFSYTPTRPLIEGLDLNVLSGQRVAIVGPTGCGKTTLINLLMRFYDVTGGGIAVDGEDIRTVTRSSLRGNFGMVLQETWLKCGTIRENIAMGRPDATDEEIVAAAKAAHAHGFIRRLAHGYDTVLGDGGGSLSQGQKQLLCIARVMLCLPPMLILDEATSSIDTRTEIRIQKAFAELTRGRTSFIVAHRLSTIREADVILVMKDGSIIEQGDHEQLLARGGFYADLYNSQFANIG